MENILNYYQRSAALLAGQFQKAPSDPPQTNLQKLIAALTSEATEIQTQLQNLITQRSLATAEGVQLDGIGQIVGLARIPGQPDDGAIINNVPVTGYRQALEFQIFINGSSGVPEDVITALKFFTQASKVWYWNFFPAAYLLATNGLSFPQNPQDLVRVIQSLSPSGVNFPYLICTYNMTPCTWAVDTDSVPFHVTPDPDAPESSQLLTSGGDYLFVDPGDFGSPLLGGHLAEYGDPIDISGAGILCESIIVGGDIP